MTDPFYGRDLTREFRDALKAIPDISRSIHRPLEIIRLTESALARSSEKLLATFRVADLLGKGGGVHAILGQMRGLEESVRRLVDLSVPQRDYFDAITSAAKLSLGSELALERLHLRRLEALNESLSKPFSQVRKTITDLSREFSEHLQGFGAGADFFSATRVVAQAPARELFLGSYSLDAIAPVESDEEGEGATAAVAPLAEIGDECASEVRGVLPDILASVDPAFVQLWEGARGALESDNPERIRHFSTSFRDLFTHLLHRLAPTHAIRAWSTNKDDFHKNKPTRRARLRYICRNVDGEHFRKFVALDIDAVLQLLQLFQQGTHELQSSLTTSQLAVMRLRMEATFIFVIDIAMSFGDD